MKLSAWSVVATIFATIVLGGCQSKFTKSHFDMIQIGVDTQMDVREMIGDPTTDLSDQWFYDDLDRHYSAVVFFDEAGRVQGKHWLDAVTGQVEGANPYSSEPPRGEVRESSHTTTRIDD